MSRIYWSTKENQVTLTGSERAYQKRFCLDLFIAAFHLPSLTKDSPFLALIPEEVSIRHDYLSSDLSLWMRNCIDTDAYFKIGKHKIDVFHMALNTALKAGNNSVKLAARIYGQCEIHAYVEKDDGIWLAEIIENGLHQSIFRSGEGWESVVKLLKENSGSSSDSPVVTSYSVSSSFPNQDLAGYESQSEWEALSFSQQWNLNIEQLRERNKTLSVQLSPHNWNDFYFSHGWDAFKINQLLLFPQERWGAIADKFEQGQYHADTAWQTAILDESKVGE